MLATLIAGSVACRDEAPPVSSEHTHAPRRLLLVSIDTLRADALGVYGASPSPSPRIDALAATARVFDDAISPMPLTRPAHFAMLTSRTPRELGVVNNQLALPEDVPTVTERMRDAGFRTAGFVAVTLLAPSSGAARGFERFSSPRDGRQRPCGPVVEEATRWIDGLAPTDDAFLWVHLFDPHLPYEGPPAADGTRPALGWADLERIADLHDGDVPLGELERARAYYRAEVEHVDACVGSLVDAFDAPRPDAPGAVVLTADHGECFEGGIFFEHADCLLEGAIHVPLILRHPRLAPGRVAGVVGLVDVAPTLLDLADLPPLDGAIGRSLAAGPVPPGRRLLIQHPIYNERTARNRSARQRRIRSVAGDPTEAVRVTGERVGLVDPRWIYLQSGEAPVLRPRAGAAGAADADLIAELDGALSELLAEHPLRILDAGEIHPDLRDALVELGYADPGPP